MRHDGGCHCGAIRLVYETALAPEATEVRACLCGFCRKHASRAVSDPAGKLNITLHDEAVIQRYRFGLGTADYLLCGRCGVYMAAVMPDAGRHFAVAIVNAFDDPERFTQAPSPPITRRKTKARAAGAAGSVGRLPRSWLFPPRGAGRRPTYYYDCAVVPDAGCGRGYARCGR